MLVKQGSPPDLHILVNECSQDLKDAFSKYKIDFQRVPPKEHRANSAERAIRTFKNHLMSILCTVDSEFPMAEWDRLLPQAVITLNLLRSSRTQPSLSAHASLFGNFDFNRTPIAPPGTRVVAHASADARASFAEHGRVGWYIGPSLQHYRCYRVYFPDTMAEVDVLTVDFFPEKIPFPKITNDDYLEQTVEDMLHLLSAKPPSRNQASLAFGSPILNAYSQIAQILGRAVNPPPTKSSPPAPIIAAPLPTPIVAPTVNIPPTPTPIAMSPSVPRVQTSTIPIPPPRVQHHVPLPHVTHPRVQKNTPPMPSPSTQYQQRTPHKYDYLQNKNYTPYNSRYVRPRYNTNQAFFQQQNHPIFNMSHQRLYAQSVQHDPSVSGKMYDPISGRAESIDSLRRGPDSEIWDKSLSNELGRCAQGLSKHRKAGNQIIGNNTIFFIYPNQVPAGRKVT